MSRRDSIRQILFVIGLFLLALLLLMGLRYGRLLPGFAGETFDRLFSLFTTPFIMEAGIACLGLIAVILLNHWRRLREGDEFVSLDDFKSSPKPEKPVTEDPPPQA